MVGFEGEGIFHNVGKNDCRNKNKKEREVMKEKGRLTSMRVFVLFWDEGLCLSV